MTATEPKKKEPLPYRAAMIGVWAPIVAIGLGIATQSALNESAKTSSPDMIKIASVIIGIVNGAFILTGFIASIIALAGVPKFGKKNLLTRGIVGILLNGFFILAAVLLLFFFHPFSGFESRIAGRWQRTARNGKNELLDIKPDKTFHFTDSGAPIANVSGTWRIATTSDTHQLVFVMTIVSADQGAPIKPGESIPWGIDKVDADQLILLTSDGSQTYNRSPDK